MHRLILAQSSRGYAHRLIDESPDGYVVTIAEPTRSTHQNACMWAMLTDLSEQVEWYGQKLTPGDWKQMATAALKRYKVVPGLEQDGSVVVIGASTSRMTKREMSELIDFIKAFGDQQGVKWTEPAEVAA